MLADVMDWTGKSDLQTVIKTVEEVLVGEVRGREAMGDEPT